MAVVKDYIQEELLKMIAEEEHNCEIRRIVPNTSLEENYQISCEENFLTKLRKFAESI